MQILKVTKPISRNQFAGNGYDVNGNDILNERLLNRFNNTNAELYLGVHSSYQSKALEDILDEGMYDYYVMTPDSKFKQKFFDMLNMMVDNARPLLLGVNDVEVIE
jgi:hypothetical protein